MPEYVYALHDFLPEHEDEVTFHAGERIEVVEKDDMYGDGWWQGRNLAGRVGLFPVSYTAPAPPAATTTSAEGSIPKIISPEAEPTNGVSDDKSPSPQNSDIISPVPKQPPAAAFLNVDGYESDFGHSQPDDASLHLASVPGPMGETMTDVQKAIEQLGRGGAGGEDHDGSRSFSFASTRDDTDTDFDLSDVDTAADGPNGADWHKDARAKLAAKARRAIEEAEKLEAMMSSNTAPGIQRSVAPPIEVELSDESDEEDFTRASKFQRPHSYILEEDETEETEAKSPPKPEPAAVETEASSLTAADNHVVVPPRDESDMATATATKLSFPVFSSPSPVAEAEPVKQVETPPSPPKAAYLTPTSPPPTVTTSANIVAIDTAPKEPIVSVQEIPIPNGLPSPSTSSQFGNHINSKHDSVVSSASAPAPVTITTIPAPATNPAPVAQIQQAPTGPDLKKSHPSEWSVEQVIEWLKGKGFDQDVCDKFIEQEITGDVLLELDVNLLKSEIGIMAFGKRMRIANAITDLRRPPSIEYSDHVASSDVTSVIHQQQSVTHSRTQSQFSHLSYPASTLVSAVQGHPQGIQTPSSQHFPGQGYAYGNPIPFVQETAPTPSQDVEQRVAAVAPTNGAVGLGISIDSKDRHALNSTSSDSALKDTATKSMVISTHTEEEDRGHMSDGDVAPTATSVRRRLFGRSADSALSFGNSRASPIPSPTARDTPDRDFKDKDSVKEGKERDRDSRDSASLGSRHARAKKSVDGGKDRLSIFGGSFSNTIKGRKPPPSASDDAAPERTSKFSLPRLHGPSLRKVSSSSRHALSTSPSASPKDVTHTISRLSDKDSDTKKEHSTLRKRTVSTPGTSSANASTVVASEVNGASGPNFKEGQNILEQIGEPDFAGWMRKKGDRYNTWKSRYFILKGPHLYWMKGDAKAETRIKGYIHIIGYKVTVDENVDPGRYGFRIDHDSDKTHFFSSEEKTIIREWMKAIMKATIGRDYTKPVVSSCNIPTIPLVVAQAMNPAPRPPSPTARDATQKALRRENPSQLSSRDARVLMGLSENEGKEDRTRLDSFFSNETSNGQDAKPSAPAIQRRTSTAPPRPSREMRRADSQRTATVNVANDPLIAWANTHLPEELQIVDSNGPLCGGLALLRLAESIKGRPSSPPVLDSAFPVDANDDKLDGLFRLFDFLLDNDVKMGSVSINDVRQGKRDKILQLLRALKSWEEKRQALANTIVKGSMQAGSSFMVPVRFDA
ncbi:hypothetical protein D9619_000742 [Psilocybe cf. subviscida]|uniref:Uncharacterized protein n=1 Tax=Psilocybe cf. subviscida TaxID=2480587 RepID=A0A8H5BFG3_9AGAR|nr:hypothetical protein D9619_000742 [Psilocybe cf. subviscida]